MLGGLTRRIKTRTETFAKSMATIASIEAANDSFGVQISFRCDDVVEEYDKYTLYSMN